MNNNASHFLPWLAWLDSMQGQMLEETIKLAEINSGTLNAQGVNRVLQQLKQLTIPLNGQLDEISLPPFQTINDQGDTTVYPLGNALRIKKRPEAPLQVFLCGHMDTVFEKDHPFQQVSWKDSETLVGPGVTDLKGGLLVMIHALMALERSPWAEHIGWEILFNPDEEIGSPSSAKLIEEASHRVHLGLIYEPCFPDGNLAGQRKGSGNFTAVSYGKAAHAGREHHLGRNAIRALCDFVSSLDNLNGKRQGVTINPGYIHGGGATNIVPDKCITRFNIRIEKPEDEEWCLQQIQVLAKEFSQQEGIKITVHGGFGRKPKILSTANQKLFELTQECGTHLGLNLHAKPSGGCCDGNNLAAFGIPNIDTLGVQGGNIHSDKEYLNIGSLVPRAKLSALLLMQLASQAEKNTLQWLKGEH